MGSDESSFNVSLTTWARAVTKNSIHKLQLLKGKNRQPKQDRTEALLLTSLTPYRQATPIHSPSPPLPPPPPPTRSMRLQVTSTESARTVGERRTATSTFTQLLSSEASCSVQCCFTSTETMRTVRDGELTQTAASTFTQLLSSESGW